VPPTATRTGLPPALLDQVLALTPEQREELFELAALEDMPPDPRTEEDWRTEIARRVADIQAGRAVLMSREEAYEQVRVEMRKLGVEL
jgi:hypothetical protein